MTFIFFHSGQLIWQSLWLTWMCRTSWDIGEVSETHLTLCEFLPSVHAVCPHFFPPAPHVFAKIAKRKIRITATTIWTPRIMTSLCALHQGVQNIYTSCTRWKWMYRLWRAWALHWKAPCKKQVVPICFCLRLDHVPVQWKNTKESETRAGISSKTGCCSC